MRRIFLSFLVILFINKQQAQLINFQNFQALYHNINAMYSKIISFEDKYNDLIGTDTSSLDEISKKLDTITSDIKKLDIHLVKIENEIKEKINTAVKKIFQFIKNHGETVNIELELNRHVESVNFLFDESIRILKREYSEMSEKNFINSVLYGHQSLRQSLYNIEKLISLDSSSFIRKGFLELFYQSEIDSYEILCDEKFSPQQELLYMYCIIITTELKGFLVLTEVHALQNKFDGVNQTHEYIDIKTSYNRRLMKYNEMFVEYMARFPTDIRRCNIKYPKGGENYFQLEGYLGILVAHEDMLTYNQKDPEGTCTTSCANIKFTQLYNTGLYVNKCEMIGGEVTLCYANVSTHRTYNWIKSEYGAMQYGHLDEKCVSESTNNNGYFRYLAYCELCLCSVESHNERFTINRISLTPQISNITQNMVVVGVRFVLHDRAIHLQIKHAVITNKGLKKSSSQWKPLDIDENRGKINFKYGSFSNQDQGRSYLHLDDVMIEPKYMVTGVRFVESETKNGHKGYELEVLSAKFDSETNELLSFFNIWNKPGDFAINAAHYKRERMEIDLSNVDDPLRTHDYYSDTVSNKKVKFHHTSQVKDVGQNTIPFFDAQSVETDPPFPLSGIGLFHRYHSGFGGYIAPRLFTYNITSDLASLASKLRKH